MIDEKIFIKELYKFADEEIEKSEEMYKAKNFDMLMQHKYGENCFYKAIQKAKDMPKINEWVPVSERLPETDENRKYLVCGEKGGIYIAEFVCNTVHGKPLGTSWWTAHGRYCPNPIAWMPLPKPYKE